MGCQFFEVQKLVLTSKKYKTFTEHYARHMDLDNPSAKDVCKIFKFEILWEGNLINITKYFGTRNCPLFLQENLHIVRRAMNPTDKEFLNRILEIEGAFRHKTTFCRLQEGSNYMVATDEHTIVCEKIFL